MVWINCDLGEGESRAMSRELIARIDWANIACGGHAGDGETIRYCLEQCLMHSVKCGAHPGIDGDRSMTDAGGDRLIEIVKEQLCDFAEIVGVEQLHHIKLHGALYHRSEADEVFADRYLDLVGAHFPAAVVVGLAEGRVIARCRERGVACAAEAFLDRGYLATGQLVPRGEEGAMIDDPAEVLRRHRSLHAAPQRVHAVTGEMLSLTVDTACVHSDSRNSLALLDALRAER